MPIRTNRGRAAVYRRLWGWPLRSPAHLVGAIVGFIVVVVALGVIVPKVMDPKSVAQTGAVPTTSTQPNQVGSLPSSGATSTLPTKLPSPPASPSAAPPVADAQVTAELWVEEWIKPPPDDDVNKWLEKLKEYTTDEFLAHMATVDPRNVPDKYTSVKAVKSTTSSIDFEVDTDVGKVILTLIKVQPDGKWRVNGYTKAS